MKINILDVITPSDRQKQSGILGTVNLEMTNDNGQPIAKLNGLTIRANKQTGERFLSEPSYKVEKQGQAATYYKHFQLYPWKRDDGDTVINAQKASNDKLTAEVVRLLDAGGTKGNKPAAAKTAPSEPWANM